MGVKTKQFVRKAIHVEGVRVTAKNFDQIKAWAGGEERLDEDKTTGTTKKYIRIETQHAKNERQRKAFIGDWVLKTEKGFKIYSNYAFHRSFDPVETAQTQVEVDPEHSERFLTWMAEDFQTYWGTLSDEDKQRLISSWTNGTGMPLAASQATPSDAVVTPPTTIEPVFSQNGGGPVDLADDVARVENPKPVVEDETGLKIEDSPTAPPPVEH